MEDQLQLTVPEIKILSIAIDSTIEDLESHMADQRLPFTPESRRDMRDMLAAAKSVRTKMQTVTGIVFAPDTITDQDIRNVFTKES